MNELRTIEDINDFAINLSYMLKIDVPSNVYIKVELPKEYYDKLVQQIESIPTDQKYSARATNWINYQIFNIKFHIASGE